MNNFEKQNNLETNNFYSYNKDAYIVWDSLSVWITNNVDVTKNAVKWGMQTWWMLEQVKKDISTIRDKKVMFLLGGTNDVFSNKTTSQIIKNIDEIAKIAKENWLKVIVWTIPPFTESNSTVQKALKKLWRKPEELYSVINEVNAYIKSNYNFIDYHKMIENPNNPNSIDPKFEAKNNPDGIHPFNAYKKMRQAQEEKFNEVILEKPKDQVSELETTINNLKYSISNFDSKISSVLGTQITPEQKKEAERITEERKKIVVELEKILSEIKKSKSELNVKNKEFDSYNNKNVEAEDSIEYKDYLDKTSDLEKRILELDEAQSILLKEFNLLSRWEKINAKLDKKDLDEMQNISAMEFLKKPYLERLKYVTIWNVDANEVASGNVKELEINFSFNGRFNRGLYMNTTAWMILPEEVRTVTVWWVEYSRKALKWEFFAENWKRLIIKDETKIQITKLETKEEIEKNFKSKINPENYQNPLDLEIALEAEKRWIPEKVAINLIKKDLERIDNPLERKALMEDLFVDIDRKKWTYTASFGNNWLAKDWKASINFLSYLSQGKRETFNQIAKDYGYSEDDIKIWETFLEEVAPMVYSGKLDMKQFEDLNISSEDVTRVRSLNRFEPGSKDAVMLFKIATKTGGFPEEWATSKALHYILWRESNGKVWVLNYTIKWMDLNEFKLRAVNSTAKNPIWAKSTASGLGQLLLSNVDIYYPSGRRWIGDPIEEAIWFMKYIQDRYGNPEIAGSVYGKIWSYTHPTKWRQYKWFKEWY